MWGGVWGASERCEAGWRGKALKMMTWVTDEVADENDD